MKQLEHELRRLKDQVIDTMYLVRNQLHKAKEAFTEHDQDLAREIRHYETRVNANELSIDRDCENILALHNPVAIDLRFVIASLKVNTQLERMGDHADAIASYVLKLDGAYDEELLKKLRFKEMFDTVLSMIDDAIHAFNFENTKLARWVFGKDATANEINRDADKIIAEYVRKHPDKIEQYLLLFSVIKKIERVGDLAKNVAEETIFYTEAKVLKHKKKMDNAKKKKN
ncbi:MAG: phosphate signaling complex protein PhoU [Saprospiraceae bacterium]